MFKKILLCGFTALLLCLTGCYAVGNTLLDAFEGVMDVHPLARFIGTLVGLKSPVMRYEDYLQEQHELNMAIGRLALAREQADLEYKQKIHLLVEMIKKNPEAAIFWLQQTAEQDDADSQYILGLCYEFGNGVRKDIPKAIEWYQLASEHLENTMIREAALEKLEKWQQTPEFSFDNFNSSPPIVNTQRSSFRRNMTAADSDFGAGITTSYRPNAYGLGVGSDQFGRPFRWQVINEPNADTSLLQVKPNAYGLGVGSDQFGRPVRAVTWP